MYRPNIGGGVYLNHYYVNVFSSKLQRGIKKNGAEDDLILPYSFSYHQPFLRYNGSKYLKTPPPLILGKYCPDRYFQGRLN